MDLHSTVSIAPTTLFQALDGEAVILDTASGSYYGLDEVGTRMWELLVQHGALQPVVEAMLAEYDVDRATLAHDLTGLVEKLAASGLVTLQSELTRQGPAT